ncbi:MAG: hypothetical protein SGPRY_001339 [Prymnesium sp.]
MPGFLLLGLAAACSAVVPHARVWPRTPSAVLRHVGPFCSLPDNNNEKADDDALQESLRARQEASKLDLPDEGDELAKAFSKRLNEEGGQTAFRLKTDAARAAEGVQEGAQKAKEVGLNVVDSAQGWASSLPPNTLRLIGIILLLSFLPSIIGIFAGGGGGASSTEFYTPTYGQV